MSKEGRQGEQGRGEAGMVRQAGRWGEEGKVRQVG